MSQNFPQHNCTDAFAEQLVNFVDLQSHWWWDVGMLSGVYVQLWGNQASVCVVDMVLRPKPQQYYTGIRHDVH